MRVCASPNPVDFLLVVVTPRMLRCPRRSFTPASSSGSPVPARRARLSVSASGHGRNRTDGLPSPEQNLVLLLLVNHLLIDAPRAAVQYARELVVAWMDGVGEVRAQVRERERGRRRWEVDRLARGLVGEGGAHAGKVQNLDRRLLQFEEVGSSVKWGRLRLQCFAQGAG